MRIINVVTTKRSGHHAFINWFLEHSPDEWHFENNRKISDLLDTVIISHAAKKTPRLIVNFEGISPSEYARVHAKQIALGFTVEELFFLRDPLNMLASTLKREGRNPARSIFRILRQILPEIHGLQSRLSQAPSRIHVSYGSWLSDSGYRSDLGRHFGLSGDELLSETSTFGGGSSFTGMQSEMTQDVRKGLFDRWLHYKDDVYFRAILTHPKFRDTFQRALDGEYPDTFGASFANAEWAEYLRGIPHDRPSPFLVDHAISTLTADDPIIAQYRSVPSLQRKIQSLTVYGTLLVAHIKKRA